MHAYNSAEIQRGIQRVHVCACKPEYDRSDILCTFKQTYKRPSDAVDMSERF